MRIVSYLIAILISVILSFPALAQYGEPGFPGGSGGNVTPVPMQEWHKRQQADQRLTTFGDDLLGDAIDPHTGTITFETTDVSIPGNFALPVAISRRRSQGAAYDENVRYGFGDWELQVPRITTVTAAPTGWSQKTYNRCSNNFGTGNFPSVTKASGNKTNMTVIFAHEYSQGVSLEVPGQGNQTVLYGKPASFPSSATHSTTGNWYLNCLTLSGGGQGFWAYAPNGDKYRFDKFIKRDYKPLGYMSPNPTHTNREKVLLLATQVQDVNGNTVNYTYTSSGNLTRIQASDGRRIDIAYGSGANANLITSVTANGRTWNYAYAATTFRWPEWERNNYPLANFRVLDRVTQPDGKYWTYDIDGMTAEPSPGEYCGAFAPDLVVKHPYGTTGTFKLKDYQHRQSYSALTRRMLTCPSGEPPAYNTNGSDPNWPPLTVTTIGTMSVTKKTLVAANAPTAIWSYEYERDTGAAGSSGSDRTNWTKVTEPSGSIMEYYHTWQAEPTGGKLDRQVVKKGSATLRTTHNDYILESANFGGTFAATGPVSGTMLKPAHTVKTQILQEGDTYTSESSFNTNQYSSSYSFGNPIQTKSYSNVSTSPRILNTTYEHNKTKWVLGLPKTLKRTDGLETARFTYDTLGRKINETRYGQPYATYGYHSNAAYKGAIYWIQDAINRRTYAHDWKRGTPQRIQRADNTNVYQYVDNNGWVTSSKDAMDRTTTYTRDNMGRMTLLNPPGSWANTSVSYNFSGGGVTQTITKGQGRTTVTYDGMFRPILERSQALDTGWSSYTNIKYNAAGQKIFNSQPSTNYTETKGVDFTYDGLGRIYQKRENVAPYATTKHRYYGSHRHRIHDPTGAWTDYYSYGYEGPGNKDYRAIYKYANGAYQQLNYLYKNVHGQMYALRQWKGGTWNSGHQTQWFYYDSQQRLRRHYVPEHGATKYDYNAAGEMIAYAKGQGNSGFGVSNISAKVTQTYDTLGRPKVTNFADPATADISRTYDANGNLKTVYRGGVNWTYYYNDADMLTHEYLDIDGRNYDSFYYYNTAGHMTRKRLPSGRNVYYTPDGLGRSKTIKNGSATIASATSFHPNGSLAGMTYGNGQRFTQTLNARLLPQRLLSYKGSTKAIDKTYGYDIEAKITSISDGAGTGDHRTYTYDGLDRLVSATGPWGTGSFTYDALGNLLQKKLGSRTVNLTYDSRNRLTQSADTGGSGTRAVGYDAQGNVTSLGNLSFIYDYSDQPVVVNGTANGVGSANGAYTYDGNLKRVKSVVNGKTIYNVYDSSGSLMHVDAVTDNKKTDYVSGPNGSLARFTNNVVTYLHPNHLGSAVTGTTSTGEIAWRERYTPFGEEMQSSSANDNLAGFTGHIKDAATGLNYMQARYYDPVIGRFLSIDPVGFIESGGDPDYFNRYSYTMNNPINLIDPTGMSACGTGSRLGGDGGAGCKTVFKTNTQSANSGSQGQEKTIQYAQLNSNHTPQSSEENSTNVCSAEPSCIVSKSEDKRGLDRQYGGVGYEDTTIVRRFWFDKKSERKILSYTCTDECGNESIALSYGIGKKGIGVQTRKTGGQYVDRKGQLHHRPQAEWPTGARSFTPSKEFLEIHNKGYQTCSEYPGCK